MLTLFGEIFYVSLALEVSGGGGMIYCWVGEHPLGGKGSPGGSGSKETACSAETWVQSLGPKNPLEKGVATHASTLACSVLWTGEPGGLQSVGPPGAGRLKADPFLGGRRPLLVARRAARSWQAPLSSVQVLIWRSGWGSSSVTTRWSTARTRGCTTPPTWGTCRPCGACCRKRATGGERCPGAVWSARSPWCFPAPEGGGRGHWGKHHQAWGR